MKEDPRTDIQIGSDVNDSVLVTGSQNVIIQAEQVMLQAAQQAAEDKHDPACMLRVLVLMAAPVYDPCSPDRVPATLDLQQEWHVLSEGVRLSKAPVLLARLAPPTLDALRSALSPRAKEQNLFPHILHFSGHAWREGLLLEDEVGQVHHASTAKILQALKEIAPPLDLVVLNGCESAADVNSVAQALLNGGLARAVVGHEKNVFDTEAVAFAARLYAELANGYALKDAVARAQKEVTTHQVVPLGEEDLHFDKLSGGTPVVDGGLPRGNLTGKNKLFLGRGRELVEISQALAHPPSATVIYGPPGIGKSSLMREAALRNAWRFPGGVAIAEGPRPEQNRRATAEELTLALAGALGMKQANDLLLYAATQPTLLLFDNLESLPDEEMAILADFLRHLGGESAALLAMRPSSEALGEIPTIRPLRLHHGLSAEEAVRYAQELARGQGISLSHQAASHIARAAGGHPRMLELLIARAGQRDLVDFLDELEESQGDYDSCLEKVYVWCAGRLEDPGKEAWACLPLFPAGCAPERVLKAAAGQKGPEKLREAALADFDAAGQVWRWHATVAEYAQRHWPLSMKELEGRKIALLPAWTKWLSRLPSGKGAASSQLEAVRSDLEAEVVVCPSSSYDDAYAFLEELDSHLPLPDRTLTLKEMAAEVWRTMLQILPLEEEARRAGLLNNLGNALSNQGRRDEALCITEEAAEIYRGLAKANPQTFLPDLATTLSNLGIKLYNQGAREKALDAAQEAVDIQRKFDEKTNPKVFMPGLARCLNNLSTILSALGRKEKALDLAQESVAINKQLAESNPQIFLPDLAVSLYTLGRRLSELNQRKEALDAVQKVVDIYKQLVWSNFQAFLPDLAASLNNLGGRLSDLGRWEEALAAAQESVNIRRRLVESNPPAFLPDLAASLNNLGKTLSFLRRGEEALAAAQECVNIHRRLAETNPQAFLPDLAMSLNNLSLGLSNLGQRREALAVVEEAVAIRRKLADANPQAFLPDLAASLNNQGLMLSALGRREQALEAAQEAADIRRKLAEANPQAFLPDLAMSLGAYGSVLQALDCHTDAAPAFAEGLQHLVPFYRDLPQAFTGLAHALRRNYVDACQKAKQEPDKDLLAQFD